MELPEISAHTITLGPPYRSCSRTQQSAYLSPRRRHSLWHDYESLWYRQKRDSSVNNTVFQRAWVQSWCVRDQSCLFWRRTGVRTFPTAGLLDLSSCVCSRRRTVIALMRGWCLPGVSAVAWVAVRKRSRRCWSTMWRSSSGYATLSRPGRGRSLTEPVSLYRLLRLIMVGGLQPIQRATSRVESPPSIRPIARLRLSCVNLGMTSNEGTERLYILSHLTRAPQNGVILDSV